MCRATIKPRDPLFKRFYTQLTELKNYLPLLPGSSNTKKTPPEELNKIILHAITNFLKRKYYIKGWDFKGKSYKETFF